jgi:hypothetical protein
MSQRMASERELTAKAVRLFHLAWVVQRVRGARMFVMEEDGKLRSYGFALRRHSSPSYTLYRARGSSSSVAITGNRRR